MMLNIFIVDGGYNGERGIREEVRIYRLEYDLICVFLKPSKVSA